jgi:hypothetical protein
MWQRFRSASGALFSILCAQNASGLDITVAESSPTRLTLDVFWGAAHFAPTNSFVSDGSTFALAVDLHPVSVYVSASHATGNQPGNRLLLDGDRTWGEEGFGMWVGGFSAGTGIFSSPPGVFHIDDAYPGMAVAPTLFPSVAGLDTYGARFVFGSPYPLDHISGGAIPEGRMWISLLPVLFVVGSVLDRRRALARGNA